MWRIHVPLPVCSHSPSLALSLLFCKFLGVPFAMASFAALRWDRVSLLLPALQRSLSSGVLRVSVVAGRAGLDESCAWVPIEFDTTGSPIEAVPFGRYDEAVPSRQSHFVVMWRISPSKAVLCARHPEPSRECGQAP